MSTVKKMKRPTKVKVLTVVYKVVWLTEDQWYAHRYSDEAIATTERDKALISMRADPTSDENALRATLLHELLHCCTQASRFERYLGEVNDAEEFFIAQVSPVLMQVFHDNAHVLAYLLSDGPLS